MKRRSKGPERGGKRGGRKPRQYEHPIPTRDAILRHLEAVGRPLALAEIGRGLDLRGSQRQRALEHRLKAMVRDGQLLRNRAQEYCLTTHLDLVSGTVSAHRDGYGFLRPDDGRADVYLSPRQMRPLWSGDHVAVTVSDGPRGTPEGRVVEILERARTEVVGPLRREGGIDYVIEEGDPRAELLIARGQRGGAHAGDIVRAEIIEHPTARSHAIGRVIAIVGRPDQAGVETDVAILTHGIPAEWPDEVVTEAERMPASVPSRAKRGREDLRKLDLVTIDGADAKDFDDAVYCERKGTGWRLIVAIADVSHYVGIGSALDSEARLRGTSVYFPDRVVPMLPEALSTGLCSLNPNVDRLCVACEMSVSDKGQVTRSRFFEAVMRSSARLTYGQASQLLTDPKRRKRRRKIADRLDALRGVYRVLARARERRGAIDFDLPETRIELDENGKVASVEPHERLETHKLIEECMIAANVEAAKRMRRAKIPGLYRVHQGPDPERLEELFLFLRTLGIKLPPIDNVRPKDLSRIVAEIAGRPEAEVIDTMILRSMNQALYQPKNIGHFGLALEAYAHFTSPIRRYPDLLVHRAIKWLAARDSMKGFGYTLEDMSHLGERTSNAERRANEAVWDVEEQLKCRYMQDHIGATFEGIVSSVVPFGVFVRIPDLAIDGLLHVSALPRDYYHRERTGVALVGERSGARFELMQRLKVRVANVHLEERKIDFVPDEAEPMESDWRSPASQTRRPRARRHRRRG